MLARSLGDTTPPDLKETLNMGPLDLPEVIPAGAGAILAEPRWPEEPRRCARPGRRTSGPWPT